MKIACAVMCFDRPQYLKLAVESFEQADMSNEIDWFFFQDGAVNFHSGIRYAEEENLDAVAKIIRETSLPRKGFYRQMFNISPAQQRYNMYQLLYGYDLLFVFEDDMIIGKQYLTLLRRMAEQFPKYVGILFTTDKKPINKRNLVSIKVDKVARLWGHYMTKENWLKIEPDLRIYYEYMKGRDFFVKPTDALPKNILIRSDDCVINRICRKYGIQKLVPFISRARYIGKKGTISYKTESYWRKKGMVNQRHDISFESDKNIKGFTIR